MNYISYTYQLVSWISSIQQYVRHPNTEAQRCNHCKDLELWSLICLAHFVLKNQHVSPELISLKMKDQVDSCLETIISCSICFYTLISIHHFSVPFFLVEFQVEGHVPLKYVLHARLDSPADGCGLQEQDHCVEWANGCFRDEGGQAPIACLSWLGISPFFLADCPCQRIFGIGDWRLHPAKPAKSWTELRGVCSARPGGLGSCGWGERTKNNGPGRIRASKMVGSKPSGLQINDASSIGQLVLTVQNSAAPMILLS